MLTACSSLPFTVLLPELNGPLSNVLSLLRCQHLLSPHSLILHTFHTNLCAVMNAQYGNADIKFTCENGGTPEACMKGIKDSDYDMTTFGGEEEDCLLCVAG